MVHKLTDQRVVCERDRETAKKFHPRQQIIISPFDTASHIQNPAPLSPYFECRIETFNCICAVNHNLMVLVLVPSHLVCLLLALSLLVLLQSIDQATAVPRVRQEILDGFGRGPTVLEIGPRVRTGQLLLTGLLVVAVAAGTRGLASDLC